ncbi:unnamed protein product, partial [Didymodactylos carnosus]
MFIGLHYLLCNRCPSSFSLYLSFYRLLGVTKTDVVSTSKLIQTLLKSQQDNKNNSLPKTETILFSTEQLISHVEQETISPLNQWILNCLDVIHDANTTQIRPMKFDFNQNSSKLNLLYEQLENYRIGSNQQIFPLEDALLYLRYVRLINVAFIYRYI